MHISPAAVGQAKLVQQMRESFTSNADRGAFGMGKVRLSPGARQEQTGGRSPASSGAELFFNSIGSIYLIKNEIIYTVTE